MNRREFSQGALATLAVTITQWATAQSTASPYPLRTVKIIAPVAPGGGVYMVVREGLTASKLALEAPRGLMQVASTKCDWNEITDELGSRFEISFNTYKPFACAIVIHPVIDACAQLRAAGVKADDVERIEIAVHSLMLELTGKKEPKDGLEAKFSVYHGSAVGLLFGEAGEGEFADALVTSDAVVSMRRKVVATVDPTIDEAEVRAVAVMKDRSRKTVHVEHAIGSLQRPLTDVDLERKFSSLVAPVLGQGALAPLMPAAWGLSAATDVRALLRLSVPV